MGGINSKKFLEWGGKKLLSQLTPLAKGEQTLNVIKNKEGQILTTGSPERIKARMGFYKALNYPKSKIFGTSTKTVDYDIDKAKIWHDKTTDRIMSKSLFVLPLTSGGIPGTSWQSPAKKAREKGEIKYSRSKDRRPFARGRII